MNAQADTWLATRVTRHSSSAWCWQTMLVPKANGDWCVCIDYRAPTKPLNTESGGQVTTRPCMIAHREANSSLSCACPKSITNCRSSKLADTRHLLPRRNGAMTGVHQVWVRPTDDSGSLLPVACGHHTSSKQGQKVASERGWTIFYSTSKLCRLLRCHSRSSSTFVEAGYSVHPDKGEFFSE